MTERPILFSAPMVRAILAGRKTQTRRIVKPRKDMGFGCPLAPHEIAGEVNHGDLTNSCYGQPGDRLWVRENGWERPERTPRMMREGADTWAPYYYDADGYNNDADRQQFRDWGFRRRPSIHMPRWASRIILEIVGIRVERLCDISDSGAQNDCTAEGVFHCGMTVPTYGEWHGAGFSSSEKFMYRQLWESISGHGSWAANPWVWVVEFRTLNDVSHP